MTYVMHPANEVNPVIVVPDDLIDALQDGLEALGLLADDLIDEDWLAGDLATADGTRLLAAAQCYRNLTPDQLTCSRPAKDALDRFFGYVDDAEGQSLVIERQQ
jgi:hypothetical protein